MPSSIRVVATLTIMPAIAIMLMCRLCRSLLMPCERGRDSASTSPVTAGSVRQTAACGAVFSSNISDDIVLQLDFLARFSNRRDSGRSLPYTYILSQHRHVLPVISEGLRPRLRYPDPHKSPCCVATLHQIRWPAGSWSMRHSTWSQLDRCSSCAQSSSPRYHHGISWQALLPCLKITEQRAARSRAERKAIGLVVGWVLRGYSIRNC
ncbi:hypothetical protein F5Y15DRAFT_396265 [Xylariaceae sp. FL0016]|nr:hypothetical protein F5Y15DRAFT_396265 [Xylariaceae sp. FL0016]